MNRLAIDLQAVAEIYGIELSADATAEYLEACAPFDQDAVRASLVIHLRDTGRGRWFPWPPTLLAYLQHESAMNGRTTH